MDSRIQQLEKYGYISESESDSQLLSSHRNRETTAEDANSG